MWREGTCLAQILARVQAHTGRSIVVDEFCTSDFERFLDAPNGPYVTCDGTTSAFQPLDRCDMEPGTFGEFACRPIQECPRRPYLLACKHGFTFVCHQFAAKLQINHEEIENSVD
jgi:hypothetical protein